MACVQSELLGRDQCEERWTRNQSVSLLQNKPLANQQVPFCDFESVHDISFVFP